MKPRVEETRSASLFDVVLVVSPDSSMVLMPAGHAARRYARDEGKGACLLLPTPPGLDFSLGVFYPKETDVVNERSGR